MTAAGSSIPYLRSTPRASAKVVGSGTVGPEPITAGSSPGTSEIRRLTRRAGWQAAPSRPPLMAERCLRTALISPMAAPERSSAPVTACLSASAIPGAGRVSSAEPPPEMRQSARSSAPSPSDQGEDARCGFAPAGVRHRMRRLDHLDRPRRHAVAVAGDDEAFEGTLPMLFHGLRHGGRRLARAHHDRAARRRRGQVGRHAARRLRAGKGRIQQAAQDNPRILAHAAPCQSPTPTSSARKRCTARRATMPPPGPESRHGSGDTGARP